MPKRPLGRPRVPARADEAVPSETDMDDEAKTPGEAGKSTKYQTGHVPKEPIEVFMARMRANCSFPETQHTEHKKVKPRKQNKLQRSIAALNAQQQMLLRELLLGKRYLVQVRGAPYACTRTDYGWSLCGLEPASVEHAVNVDATICSCPDHRVRKRTCKHMEAMCAFLKR